METLTNKIKEHGVIIDTALEGTCLLINYGNAEYVMLSDNTIITRSEDNEDPEGAIFPYSKG